MCGQRDGRERGIKAEGMRDGKKRKETKKHIPFSFALFFPSASLSQCAPPPSSLLFSLLSLCSEKRSGCRFSCHRSHVPFSLLSLFPSTALSLSRPPQRQCVAEERQGLQADLVSVCLQGDLLGKVGHGLAKGVGRPIHVHLFLVHLLRCRQDARQKRGRASVCVHVCVRV